MDNNLIVNRQPKCYLCKKRGPDKYYYWVDKFNSLAHFECIPDIGLNEPKSLPFQILKKINQWWLSFVGRCPDDGGKIVWDTYHNECEVCGKRFS